MTVHLCFPIDDATGDGIDFDRIADFLELTTFFANDCTTLVSDIANQAIIGAAEEPADLDEEMRRGVEEVVSGAVLRIEERRIALDTAYPFELDNDGNSLTYIPAQPSVGQAAYILSLVLSNLRALSPILDGSDVHPDDGEVRTLRQYFQYFATAALAAEIRGHAWSFGFPRPDGSGFIAKLKEIWQYLGDGRVEAQVGAPECPKDDQVDVFAARPHPDRLPGFPVAAAQVATGKNVKDKSLRGHLGAFKGRWFARQPVTDFAPYMIVPFARDQDSFVDDVRVMGNVLHRLRVPRRVEEAEELMGANVTVEGYDRLAEAAQWVVDYRASAEGAA